MGQDNTKHEYSITCNCLDCIEEQNERALDAA